jgi:hypothetical protein
MKTQNNQMSRDATDAIIHGVMLSVLCLISYWLLTHMLARAFSVSRDDDLLGGMWAGRESSPDRRARTRFSRRGGIRTRAENQPVLCYRAGSAMGQAADRTGL